MLNYSNLFNKEAAEICEKSTDVYSLLNDTFLVLMDWSSNKFESLEPREKIDETVKSLVGSYAMCICTFFLRI